MTDQHN